VSILARAQIRFEIDGAHKFSSFRSSQISRNYVLFRRPRGGQVKPSRLPETINWLLSLGIDPSLLDLNLLELRKDHRHDLLLRLSCYPEAIDKLDSCCLYRTASRFNHEQVGIINDSRYESSISNGGFITLYL
jgi:hypothetical protein